MVSAQAAAMLLTFVVHVIGGAILIAGMFQGGRPDVSGWWPRDDWGRPPEDPPPGPRGGPGGLPLPDAEPGPRRRDHTAPRWERRPRRTHPAPAPGRVPTAAPGGRDAA